ncbi:hypothetical protein [Sphingobium sp.]|uniref:hypothetical protein n=1 Tax=Sphingobium sp. TaxID=1912891 RepID=UPI002D08F3D8|nr:hypothetical protein [Sphingobium sp.]HUD89957.1 hypothetical protein [Sphingobium sp.]
MQFEIGQRVVLTHPTMGRDYATVAGEGERPETISLNVDGRAFNPQTHWRSCVTPAIAGRDMVIGDLLNLAMLKEVFEKPFLGTLWTDGDSGILTPYVCECSFGDGLKLIKIATINQRPNYHVVRVDSGWATSNWDDGETVGEHIDDILSAIEEECGPARPYCEECETSYCECEWPEGYSAQEAFPAIDDENGCSWSEVSWKWLMRQIGGAK